MDAGWHGYEPASGTDKVVDIMNPASYSSGADLVSHIFPSPPAFHGNHWLQFNTTGSSIGCIDRI